MNTESLEKRVEELETHLNTLLELLIDQAAVICATREFAGADADVLFQSRRNHHKDKIPDQLLEDLPALREWRSRILRDRRHKDLP